MKIEQKEIVQIPRRETVYVSDDGKRFDSEDRCWLYEKDISMEQEGRIKALDYSWHLFNSQSELDEYCQRIRANKRNIDKSTGRFPIWVRFEYCYSDNQWEEYITIPLSKHDYDDVCELKKMIETTQL